VILFPQVKRLGALNSRELSHTSAADHMLTSLTSETVLRHLFLQHKKSPAAINPLTPAVTNMQQTV